MHLKSKEGSSYTSMSMLTPKCLKYLNRSRRWVRSVTWGAVFMAREPADLGHHLHQSLHILHYSALKLCNGVTEAERTVTLREKPLST